MQQLSMRAWVASLVTAGVLLGVVVGGLGAFYLMSGSGGRILAAFMAHHALIDAQEHLSLARQLAQGNSAALRQRVQLLLGADLPVLQSSCSNRDAVDQESACSLLRADVQYLQAHPLATGNTAFDAMLQSALEDGDEQPPPSIALPTSHP
ncbi:MAG: hypothetical protein ABT19_15850 [Rhodanobacter sp. SCN 68-63]|nr:MAG: hypothetical protein ABT19_15850 [Rhodanobacter sp. SCN 68-63]